MSCETCDGSGSVLVSGPGFSYTMPCEECGDEPDETRTRDTSPTKLERMIDAEFEELEAQKNAR